jgi:hypothetical protein
LELLKEAAPNIARVALIYPEISGPTYLHSIETAGRSLGVQVVAIPVSDATGMKTAIEAFPAGPNSGLIPSPGTFAIVPPDELSRLALEYRLAMVSPGGLIDYFADFDEIGRSKLRSIAYSAIPRLAICRCNTRPSSACRSISKLRSRSGLRCRPRFSRAPTR